MLPSGSFVDEISIFVEGGKGGNGCVSVRREKFVPKGGPDGGDGGRGGDVILKVNEDYNTLVHLVERRHFKAKRGQHGMGKKKFGKDGENCIVPVPKGCQVFVDGEKIADLINNGDELVIAMGGKGGRGNASFKTQRNTCPMFAEEGKEAEKKKVTLKLILLADVAIIGFPNAGKSTLISKISSSHPKIADYPFTTIAPNLGVVYIDDFSHFTVCDIPGIIEDAHKGKGLGNRFLRHLERARVLIHLLDGCNNPLLRYSQLNEELRLYSEDVYKKPEIVALNKIDLKEARENIEIVKEKIPDVIPISCLTGEGIEKLVTEVARITL